MKRTLTSRVPGHEGPCRATWTHSPGGIYHRLDGGLCGFFRRVEKRRWLPGYRMVGPEFHGIIFRLPIVESSAFPTRGDNTGDQQ